MFFKLFWPLQLTNPNASDDHIRSDSAFEFGLRCRRCAQRRHGFRLPGVARVKVRMNAVLGFCDATHHSSSLDSAYRPAMDLLYYYLNTSPMRVAHHLALGGLRNVEGFRVYRGNTRNSSAT